MPGEVRAARGQATVAANAEASANLCKERSHGNEILVTATPLRVKPHANRSGHDSVWRVDAILGETIDVLGSLLRYSLLLAKFPGYLPRTILTGSSGRKSRRRLMGHGAGLSVRTRANVAGEPAFLCLLNSNTEQPTPDRRCGYLR
jgi:hypothetical protein